MNAIDIYIPAAIVLSAFNKNKHAAIMVAASYADLIGKWIYVYWFMK